MTDDYQRYYVPEQSYWPIIGSIGLFTMVIGGINILHTQDYAWLIFLAGAFITVFMMFGWFGNVVKESRKGLYSPQLDRSFRWGMVWFIFSEAMFFAAFFGALFYARHYSIPWMGGIGAKPATHALLWEHFTALWPLLQNPDPAKFVGPFEAMGAWGLPTLNTLILLSSGGTLTFAHLALKNNHRKKLVIGLMATVALGILFLSLQGYEYYHAYTKLGLKLNSGIYGSTFFMLTGFHGAHVTIGTIMLTVILVRCIRGHFTPEKHFGFEATAWYWHFVDVVWLMLFIFVYWL
ncbi:MAG TPA: cytochrome c oxidase subunit 3 [Gammaproteobacteria bacterium]|nr:cytochrome c oxidase subunit 3 [Gammaproteobacteria bacterium]